MNSVFKRGHFWCLVLAVGLAASSCQKAAPKTALKSEIPAAWLVGSESETEVEKDQMKNPVFTGSALYSDDTQADEEAPALAMTTSDLLKVQESSLESVAPAVSPPSAPWRLSAVMTDLSVSVSGFLGFLVQKGTPSVTTIWRRQFPKVSSPQAFVETSNADLVVDENSSRAEIEKNLEPSIRALLSMGTIHGESNLRQNLVAAAENFQSASAALSTSTERGQWWVSRFRLDFTVDASGKVTPAVTVGGEAKVRFEWHRLRTKNPSAKLVSSQPFLGTPGLAENLAEFAGSLADDLSAIADGSKISSKGFRAYGYRVGLGVTENGNVGIAKVVGTLIGHLYFSRDVTKPVVNPKPIEKTSPVLLVGDSNTSGGPAKIDRKSFRMGLKKALRIGHFFARRAEKFHGKWKIHELRTGFDLSYGGKTGLSKVSGLASTEISFYNLNF